MEYHTSISASFYKTNEEDQSDEIDIYKSLKNENNLTESDNNNIENKSQLEYQIPIQETKDSG